MPARTLGVPVIVTSVETALFELVGAAGTPEFKRVEELVK